MALIIWIAFRSLIWSRRIVQMVKPVAEYESRSLGNGSGRWRAAKEAEWIEGNARKREPPRADIRCNVWDIWRVAWSSHYCGYLGLINALTLSDV